MAAEEQHVHTWSERSTPEHAQTKKIFSPWRAAPDTNNKALPSLVDRLGFLTINPFGIKPPHIQYERRRTTTAAILDVLMNPDGQLRTLVQDTPIIRQDATRPQVTWVRH